MKYTFGAIVLCLALIGGVCLAAIAEAHTLISHYDNCEIVSGTFGSFPQGTNQITITSDQGSVIKSFVGSSGTVSATADELSVDVTDDIDHTYAFSWSADGGGNSGSFAWNTDDCNPPDTTVPTTTVVDTTVPTTTVVDTTVPTTTVPDTTVPDTTVPVTTVPDTTVPDTDCDDTDDNPLNDCLIPPVSTVVPPPPTNVAPPESLPRTGSNVGPLILLGVILLAAGALVVRRSKTI